MSGEEGVQRYDQCNANPTALIRVHLDRKASFDFGRFVYPMFPCYVPHKFFDHGALALAGTELFTLTSISIRSRLKIRPRLRFTCTTSPL
jgi:hypothetical protein